MAKTQYEIMQAEKPKAPPISLIRIQGNRNLIASLDAFGPDTFNRNVAEMQKQYSHPTKTGEVISLKEPTTAESLIVAAYDFANKAKPKIFNSRWLQAGRILRASEGVFVNIPREADGNLITDEQTLKSFLTPVKKDKGIYILGNDFAYAGYETFKQGEQDAGNFIEGGLARVLEASQNPESLKEISSKENYPRGVYVWGFDPVDKPLLRVAGLYSYGLGDRRLGVVGDWDDYVGCAFGVLK